MKGVYVFDIDGVLLYMWSSFIHRLGKSEHWSPPSMNPECSGRVTPRDLGIKLLMDRSVKGRVILVTGRPERKRRNTVAQLKELGVYKHVDALLMRRDDDRRPEWEVKPELLEAFVDDPYSVLEIHEDNERVLKAYSKRFPYALLYLHADRGFSLYDPSRSYSRTLDLMEEGLY